MGKLFDEIRQAVREERYVAGLHANERPRERRIPAWQIIAGIDTGMLLAERPGSEPNPVAEVQEDLLDGTAVKAICAWLEVDDTAKRVTVHVFDA